MKLNNSIKLVLAMFILLALSMQLAYGGIPSNPDITYNLTETVTPKPNAYLNTSGGSFTTLVLNATGQNYKWKAYVGNVTGALALQDQTNYSIYDWDMSTISGNVFVSRNETIDWSNLSCAKRASIESEDTYLNLDSTHLDSINRTFNSTTHKQFFAASNNIGVSTCPAISTYVNGTAQTNGESNHFQEIVLEDTYSSIIYTTIIENAVFGFDNGVYDFQMIVPEDETTPEATNYYFYLEII